MPETQGLLNAVYDSTNRALRFVAPTGTGYVPLGADVTVAAPSGGNDTATITAAMAAVAAGGRLLFRSGTYLVTGTLGSVASNTEWVGKGRGRTTIIFTATARNQVAITIPHGTTNFGIRGFTLKGLGVPTISTTGTTGAAANTLSDANAHFLTTATVGMGIYIIDAGTPGTSSKGGTFQGTIASIVDDTNVTLSANTATALTGTAYYAFGGGDFSLNNIMSYCLYFTEGAGSDGSDILIEDNEIAGFAQSGVHSDGLATSQFRRVTIRGNRFHDIGLASTLSMNLTQTGHTGIVLPTGTEAAIVDNMFANIGYEFIHDWAVYLNRVNTSVLIRGNRLWQCAGFQMASGVEHKVNLTGNVGRNLLCSALVVDQGCDYVNFSGNVMEFNPNNPLNVGCLMVSWGSGTLIEANVFDLKSGAMYALEVGTGSQAVTDLTVTGNVFANCVGNNTALCHLTNANASTSLVRCAITNNEMYGAATAGVYAIVASAQIGNTVTDLTIAGNRFYNFASGVNLKGDATGLLLSRVRVESNEIQSSDTAVKAGASGAAVDQVSVLNNRVIGAGVISWVASTNIVMRGNHRSATPPAKTVTGATTLTATDRVVIGDTTSGAFSIKLPQPGAYDMEYTILTKTTSANALTIDGNGTNVNGAATLVLATGTAYVGKTVRFDGATWVAV